MSGAGASVQPAAALAEPPTHPLKATLPIAAHGAVSNGASSSHVESGEAIKSSEATVGQPAEDRLLPAHPQGSTSSSAAAAAARRSAPVITPSGFLLERTSLVRMLTQSLSALGYDEAAGALQRESGVEMESRPLVHFRSAVLRGDWETATEALEFLPVGSRAHRLSIRRLLYEQRYISMLERALQLKESPVHASNGATSTATTASTSTKEQKEAEQKQNGAVRNGHLAAGGSDVSPSGTAMLMQALAFLQSDVAPLYATAVSKTAAAGAGGSAAASPNPHVLHLASLFTCASVAALRATYRGPAVLASAAAPSAATASSSSSSSPYLPLLQRLATHLPSAALIPQEAQLLRVLEHSVHAQMRACSFHEPGDQTVFDLSQQHRTLPTRPLLTLRDHEDEVLYVSFSHVRAEPHRLRIASCSKDRTIKIFAMPSDPLNKSPRALAGEAEHKQRATNGHATSATNGHTSASASAATGATAASEPLEFVCTGVLQAPPMSRPSTPQSGVSDSPRGGGNHANGLTPLAPYFSVVWSPDNQHVLACNGVEASVFHVEQGVCILTVGSAAVDNLARSGSQQAAVAAAARASGSGVAASSRAAASSHVPSLAAPPFPPAAAAISSSALAVPPLIHSSFGGYSMIPPVAQSPVAPPSLPAGHSALRLPRALLSSSVLAALGLQPNLYDESSHVSVADDDDYVAGHAEPVTCCAWVSSEGDVAGGSDGSEAGKSTARASADASPLIVTGSSDRRLILWDLSGEVLDVWSGDMISDVAVVGSRMLVATPHHKCILFRIHKRRIEEIATLHETGNIASISLSEDGQLALISVIRPAELHVWDLGPIEKPQESAQPADSAISASSAATTAAATASSSSDPAASLLSNPGALQSLGLLPSPVPASSSPPPLMPTLLRRYTGFHAHRYVLRGCFAGPGSSVLLTGSEDGMVYAWARNGMPPSDSVAPPANGDASGRMDPVDDALMGRLRAHTATVNCVAATRFQGKHIVASASDDHTIHLWRLRTATQQHAHAHAQHDHGMHTSH